MATDPISTSGLLTALEGRVKLAEDAVGELRDAAAKGDRNGILGALLMVQDVLGPALTMTEGAVALLKADRRPG